MATLNLSNPIGAVSGGVLTFATITPDVNAAGGVIAFATIGAAAGTVAFHVAVATSGSDINVTSGGLTVYAGDTVSCASMTYTAPP